MKQQIVFIHGGDAHASYEEYIAELKNTELDIDSLRSETKGWKDSLQKNLDVGFDVLFPEMPSWMNAKYVEWKIWFEKIPPFLSGPVILIGHSLGAIFLAKYLAENTLPNKIKAVFLLSGPYRTATSKEQLADFVLPDTLTKIQEQCDTIFIYQSKDDPLVDFIDAENYAKALPKARLVVFEDRGHFLQQEFPEIVEQIISLTK